MDKKMNRQKIFTDLVDIATNRLKVKKSQIAEIVGVDKLTMSCLYSTKNKRQPQIDHIQNLLDYLNMGLFIGARNYYQLVDFSDVNQFVISKINKAQSEDD